MFEVEIVDQGIVADTLQLKEEPAVGMVIETAEGDMYIESLEKQPVSGSDYRVHVTYMVDDDLGWIEELTAPVDAASAEAEADQQRKEFSEMIRDWFDA